MKDLQDKCRGALVGGSVGGNIIGTILGYSAIPKKYLATLELHDVLVSVADDLSGTSSEEQMKERYVK